MEELAVVFQEHKVTNKNQIEEFTNRMDQAFAEEKEMWQIGKSPNVQWQSKMSNQLQDVTAQSKMSNQLQDVTSHCKGEAEFSGQTTSSKQMDLITTVISIATEVESTPVGLAVAAKDGTVDEQF